MGPRLGARPQPAASLGTPLTPACLAFEASTSSPQVALYGEQWARRALAGEPGGPRPLLPPAECPPRTPRLQLKVALLPARARAESACLSPAAPGTHRLWLRLEWPPEPTAAGVGAPGRALEASATFGGHRSPPWVSTSVQADAGHVRADFGEAVQAAWASLMRKRRLLLAGPPEWTDMVASVAAREATNPSTGPFQWEEAAVAIDCFAEARARAGVEPLLELIRRGAEVEAGHLLRPLALRAIGALGRIGDRRAVIPLIDAATHQPSEHLVQTAYAVAQLGGRNAQGWLLALASAHDDDRVRQAAADALADLPREKGGL